MSPCPLRSSRTRPERSPTRCGRDSVSRLESAFTWRLFGHHAIGIQYVWSHRSATFSTGNERKQTLAQIGIFYTLLGRQDFGAVQWPRDGE